MTASIVPFVRLACLTAQRSAVRDDGEPSTPTTIRGAPFVLTADISTRSLPVLMRASQLGGRGDQLDPGRLQPVGDNPCEQLGKFVTERGVGRTACSHGRPVEFEGLDGGSGYGAERPLER